MSSSQLFKLIIAFLVWVPQSVYSQSLVCRATVEAVRLTPVEQEDLKNLARDIETYINEFEYTDESYDLVFEMTIQKIVR